MSLVPNRSKQRAHPSGGVWEGFRGALRRAAGRGAARRLVLVAVLLLGVAAADPVVTLRRPVYDVVVVLDISQSMDVTDYRVDGLPVSRLDFAKAGLRRALLALPCGSRVGWGVFAAYRVLLLTGQAEVCANYGDMAAVLARIDNRMAWTNASEIGKGLANALQAARALPDAPAVVFITDGNEAPPAVAARPLDFGRGPQRIAGVLVGAGGDVPQPIPMSDPDGRPLGFWSQREGGQPVAPGADDGVARSRLQEAHLIALAGAAGLSYQRLETPDDLAQILARPALAHPHPTRVALGPWLAGLALAALLGVFLAPWLRRARARPASAKP